MPRGEHFKKENPRINQVSFKVNDTELKALQALAKENGVAVATWLRNQINTPSLGGSVQPTSSVEGGSSRVQEGTPSTQKMKSKERPAGSVVPEVLIPTPKIEKIEVKKSKEKVPPANEQMSLF